MKYYKYIMEQKTTPTTLVTGNLRSIWDNNFYNTPPALSWTYKLVFDDFVNFSTKNVNGDIVNLVTAEHMASLNKAAVSINIGERKVENTEVYYGGLNFKVLTRVDNTGSFTVKFNEDSNLTITSILETLYSLYGNNKFYYMNTMNTNTPYANDMRHSDEVYDVNTGHNIISAKIFNPNCLNDNKESVNYRHYKFYNCKLIGIESIEYSYDSTDTITRNATFMYDWMEYNVVYDNREATV